MKQVMVVRKDLNMSPGKVAAQCCHASLMAFLGADKMRNADSTHWFHQGQTKVILMVDNEAQLLDLHAAIEKDKGLLKRSYLVRDAGHTELKGQNLTVLGIGPAPDELIDKHTKQLKLYR